MDGDSLFADRHRVMTVWIAGHQDGRMCKPRVNNLMCPREWGAQKNLQFQLAKEKL